MTAPLTSIRVVLCHPTDSRNVGGAIRAVANAGLAGIRVVTEVEFDPRDLHCYSAGARQVTEVQFFTTVREAVADCNLVVGTSRRPHDVDAPPEWPSAGLRQRFPVSSTVAILFGAERTGLLKPELDLCSAFVQIATSPTYPSMNLAHAVACIGYELARPEDAHLLGPARVEDAPRLSAGARDAFFDRMAVLLTRLNYPPGKSPTAFVRRLRKILHRANPNQKELSMIGGIFGEMERLAKLAGTLGADQQNGDGDDGGEGH